MAEVAKGIIEIEINTGSAASKLQALQSQINAFSLALNKNNTTQGKFAAKYSKELQDAINKTGFFTAETVKLSTAAFTLDKTLSKGKTSLSQYFSAKFNKGGAMHAETLALASERARRLQTQFIATSGAANGFQEALAVRPLAAFSSNAVVAAEKTRILSSMFKQGTTQLINFGKNVQWAGRQLMVGFTVPLTIFGAMAGKTFREIEKEAVNFKKVYGDIFTTDQEIEDQLKNVKELSKEFTKYGIAVKDTMQLAAIGAQAGKTGAELQEATIQATRLAVLGDLDRQEAMRTTIALQSAFKMSNEELGNSINFLNMVENSSVLSLQDLSESIPRVAPVIVGLGGTVKEMAVFLTAMREGGVNAAEAANGLKSSLGRLITPTRQATEMANGFGISLDGIVQANEGNVLGMVISLSQAMKQLTDLQKQQLLSAVFGKFQFARMGALFENITREGSQASRVIEMMGMSIEDMASTAEKELSAIEESAGTQIVAAMERFKLAIEPIGELFTKLAIPVLNFLTRMVEGFNSLSDGQKKLAAIATVVIGVVIPALTMMAGLFLNLVGTLAKLGQGIALFIKGFVTGGPIGAIKALTQSSKYLSLAEIDAAMAAQQLAGSTAILNKTLVDQAIQGNAAAAAIGNLTRAYGAMIATQGAAAGAFPGHFGVAGAAGARAKASQMVIRGVQARNSGGPIFMSNGTTVPGTGNTDTVPAMLTPGEFVVNKEATKNNLGLLHSINNSKKPQGLNAGGKAKGVQYLNDAGQVRESDLTDADIDNLNRFDNDNTPAQPGRRRRAGQVAGNAPAVNSTPLLDIPEFQQRYISKYSPATILLPYEMNEKLKSGGGGVSVKELLEYAIDAGEDIFDPTKTTFSSSINPRTGMPLGMEFDSRSAYQKFLNNLQEISTRDPNLMISDSSGNPEQSLRRLVDRSISSRERTLIARMRRDFIGKFRVQGTGAFITLPKAERETAKINFLDEQLRLVQQNTGNEGMYWTQGTNTKARELSPASIDPDGSRQGKPLNVFRYANGEVFASYRAGNTLTIPGSSTANIYDSTIYSNSRRDAVNRMITRNTKARLSGGRTGLLTAATKLVFAHFNKGGQVPGMQYFAANNRQRVVQEAYNAASGIRRRVRPGRDQRFSQQAVLKDYVHNPSFIRNSKDPEDMNTLLSMMKPLTQKTRATRGTVLGSTWNKELPYAQQKRIVAAIKEGRYEDLFGMKLNFKGPGSYTTRRETDFSPFIGDLSNPTLKDFSYGFMGLDTQKKDVDKLRKLIRSGKFKKLTPGTAEYARELGMTGLWSPARSFRPGANPTIGSDWTIEQVLANKLREYKNTKNRLNKTFPDKKIQQLLIDEMVGSGTLAIDVQKSFYKHPRLPYRGNHIENLVKKENEILLGNRTSQITGVATDLRTKLPSLITQSGVKGYNKGGMIPGGSVTPERNFYGYVSRMVAEKFSKGLYHAGQIDGPLKPMGTGSRGTGFYSTESISTANVFKDALKADNLYKLGFSQEQIAMIQSGKVKIYDHSNPAHRKDIAIKLGYAPESKNPKDVYFTKKGTPDVYDVPLYDEIRQGALQKAGYDVGIFPLGYSVDRGGKYLKTSKAEMFSKVRIKDGMFTKDYYDNFVRPTNNMFETGSNEIIFTTSKILPSNVVKANKGSIVPGVGNTDTVPAMLTPGEFVINKESTKKNYDLLTAINDGQLPKFNKGGKIPGVQYFAKKNKQRVVQEQTARNSKVAGRAVGAGMAGSAVVGTASFMLAEKAGIDSMAGQFAASIAAGMVAQKALASATIKLSKNTMTAAEKTKALSPWLSKMSPSLARFAVPLVGATAAFAILGFAVYSLNKSLKKSEKAGAELSEAMYGSAKTTKAMGEAFGRETYASAAMRKQAEKSGGQEISQEAVAASGEFMKSDAAKGIVEDIKLVQKSGESAVLALRNQLTSSILAGVISPEEARAIALDVGKELGSTTLGVQVSGELSSLIGPNGEKILNNVVEITAAITPKIDITKIQKDAQGAFDSLNPGEKFIQFFKGGQESFVQTFSIDQISSANASALAKEAEARSLLNLAYQEGTITLKEYLDAEGKITSGSNERSKFVEDANAQALGFSSTEDMNAQLDGYMELKNKQSEVANEISRLAREGRRDPKLEEQSKGLALALSTDPRRKAYDEVVTKSKDTLRQSFVDSGMDEGMAQTKVDSLSGVSNIDPRIFEKLSSGQMPLQGIDFLVNLQSTGDLQPEDIDRIGKELTALTTIPKIDKVINFETANEEMITEAYDAYVALEEQPEIFKGISIKDGKNKDGTDFLALDQMHQFGINYEWIMSLPDQEKFIVLTTIEKHVKLQDAANNVGDLSDRLALGQSNADMAKLKENTVDFGGTQDFSPPPGGSGGGSGKQTLKGYIKEFREATNEKMKFFKATNHILGTAKQEALALIDTEMYLKANKKQRAELIKLAEKQLNIQRATAFLSMSTEEKTLLSLNMQEKALNKRSQKEEKSLRTKQRQTELNNRALEDLAEKEDAVNKTYDDRLKALDKVSQANDRIAQQNSSRLSLATALASGDIAAAANAANEMKQQNAQYQIEDTRAALEEQRKRDIESLTISVNGKLMTRNELEAANKAIQEEVEVIQDRMFNLETERLTLAEKRADAELRTFLLQQKQTIEALKLKEINGELTKAQKGYLKTLMVDFKNLAGVSHSQYKQYGGKIAKMAFGGTAFKGSTESPPSLLRMNRGSTVPGIGMTDKVPAMLTPGEFVVRKPVADQNRPFLDALNSQVFPGIGGSKTVPTNNFLDGIGSPRYSIPEQSTGSIPVNNASSQSSSVYNNTYSVNVNVSGTNSSPDDIANVVMAKLSNQNRGNLRSSRY